MLQALVVAPPQLPACHPACTHRPCWPRRTPGCPVPATEGGAGAATLCAYLFSSSGRACVQGLAIDVPQATQRKTELYLQVAGGWGAGGRGGWLVWRGGVGARAGRAPPCEGLWCIHVPPCWQPSH